MKRQTKRMDVRQALVGALLVLLPGMARGDAGAAVRELAREADVVMLGECVHEEAQWSADGRVIVTRATLRAKRLMKGTAGDEVVVQVLGGTVGDVSMGASHGATIAPGEEAVFFLRRSSRGSYHVVHGGNAGKLALEPQKRGRVRTASGATLSLEEIAAAVEAEARR